MSEEDIARCFVIEDWRKHPELHVAIADKTYICDAKHAASFYCQGWNDRIKNNWRDPLYHGHPAALRAYQMGWADCVPGRDAYVELPSVL